MAASARRQPLMSIPNATNSPHRILNNSGSKRPRAAANLSQQENEPPSKRQAVDKTAHDPVPVTPRRHRQPDSTEGKVFERGRGDASNAFQRRLVAARDRTTQSKTTRSNNTATNPKDVEQVRQWQKHYRKLFPTFSFYFDSLPDDMKTRFSKQIQHLGAREEKFFSKQVTHIVTTRAIPHSSTSSKSSGQDAGQGTINPSLLDVKIGRTNTSRRDAVNNNNNDILVRGLEMDMKIWATEKLQRMLATLLNEGQAQDGTHRGQHAAGRVQNDLAQVLKQDKLAAAAEKEHVGMPRDFVPFRGPFIYIHDMDEKVRPIMVREYPRVARRTDGEWPQFRSASVGKCPFVEDPQIKKEIEQERARQRAAQLQQQKEAQKLMMNESTITIEPARMEPPRRTSPRKVLRERPNANVVAAQQPVIKALPPPERQSSFPPMPAHPPIEFIKPSQMQLIREPSASGINKSAVTSAIQSQMISSAAATGLKAGTSKEVNELKRKVLERTHTGSLSMGSISSSHQVASLAGALKNARAPAPQRAAKSRAQEKLGGIQEEVDPYADDLAAEHASRAVVKKKKQPAKREPKPGYCENCHDKYDDFEDHIVSRKHRKFATTDSNWNDLDSLLAKLQAP